MSKDLLALAESLSTSEPDEALRIANGVLNAEPNNPRALFIAGFVMMKAERWGLAYNIFKRAIELAPSVDACYNNAGMCAASCTNADNNGMLDEAEKLLRKALKLNKNSTACRNNLALVGVHRCDPDMALRFAKDSLAINKDQPEAHESLGYAHLMRRNWAEGWDGYEKAIGWSKYRKDFQYGNEHYWQGQTGGRLIVRGEQGIGDEISFASCIPDAVRDNKITFECDRRLEGLFRRSFPDVEVVGTRFDKEREWSKVRDWDYHCLVGTLAARYRRTTESFPGTPYLVPDPERRLQWRALLDTLPGRRVGLAWTGGLPNTFRYRRSFPLESLLPLLKTPGITWVSMQYKDPTAEIEALEERHGIKIHHWARATESPDYDETAALAMELDQVVSTTTALVHLCGAIGQKCWVMVPKKPRWFYGLEGNTIPWYNSVSLYRQSDKWPVERIAADLK